MSRLRLRTIAAIHVSGALFVAAYSPAWFQILTKLSCNASSARGLSRTIRSETPNSFALVAS